MDFKSEFAVLKDKYSFQFNIQKIVKIFSSYKYMHIHLELVY